MKKRFLIYSMALLISLSACGVKETTDSVKNEETIDVENKDEQKEEIIEKEYVLTKRSQYVYSYNGVKCYIREIEYDLEGNILSEYESQMINDSTWESKRKVYKNGNAEKCLIYYEGQDEPDYVIEYENYYDESGKIISRTYMDQDGKFYEEKFNEDGIIIYSCKNNGEWQVTHGKESEEEKIIKTITEYNNQGNRISEIEYNENNEKLCEYYWEYEYDEHGNWLSYSYSGLTRLHASEEGEFVSYFEQEFQNEYDENEKLIKQTVISENGERSVSKYEYDEHGNCVKILSNNRVTVENEYTEK